MLLLFRKQIEYILIKLSLIMKTEIHSNFLLIGRIVQINIIQVNFSMKTRD
jgi:hypothetical protein